MANTAYVSTIMIAFQEESLPYLDVEYYAVVVDAENAVTIPYTPVDYRLGGRVQIPFTAETSLTLSDVQSAIVSDVQTQFADDTLNFVFLS